MLILLLTYNWRYKLKIFSYWISLYLMEDGQNFFIFPMDSTFVHVFTRVRLFFTHYICLYSCSILDIL